MSETRFGSAGVKIPSGCVLWQQRELMRNLTRRRNDAARQAARPVISRRIAIARGLASARGFRCMVINALMMLSRAVLMANSK